MNCNTVLHWFCDNVLTLASKILLGHSWEMHKLKMYPGEKETGGKTQFSKVKSLQQDSRNNRKWSPDAAQISLLRLYLLPIVHF